MIFGISNSEIKVLVREPGLKIRSIMGVISSITESGIKLTS